MDTLGIFTRNIVINIHHYSPNQVAVPDERPAAHITFVILARRMRAYVHGELRFAGECHGTPVAAERLFRHVRPSMMPEQKRSSV